MFPRRFLPCHEEVEKDLTSPAWNRSQPGSATSSAWANARATSDMCGLPCLGDCHGFHRPISTTDALGSFRDLTPGPTADARKCRLPVGGKRHSGGAPPPRPSPPTAKVSVLHSQRTPDTNPSILTIELIGSYTARHVETGLTVDLTSSRNRSRTKGPISPLCRKLIDLGHDPETRVHVTRKALDRDRHIAVFKRDRSLRAWAAADCVETEKASVYVVKYQPFPRHLFPSR